MELTSWDATNCRGVKDAVQNARCEYLAAKEGSAVPGDFSAATRDDFCALSVAAQPDDQYVITFNDGQACQVGSVENFYGPLQSG